MDTLSGKINDENLGNARGQCKLTYYIQINQRGLFRWLDCDSIVIREERDVHAMFKETTEFPGEKNYYVNRGNTICQIIENLQNKD